MKRFNYQHFLLLMSVFWSPFVYAIGLQGFFAKYSWDAIVLLIVFTIPFGAWLGAIIPPPEGYNLKGWTTRAKFLSGVAVGSATAFTLTGLVDPLVITVIPPILFSAVSGAALLQLIRKITLHKFSEGSP